MVEQVRNMTLATFAMTGNPPVAANTIIDADSLMVFRD